MRRETILRVTLAALLIGSGVFPVMSISATAEEEDATGEGEESEDWTDGPGNATDWGRYSIPLDEYLLIWSRYNDDDETFDKQSEDTREELEKHLEENDGKYNTSEKAQILATYDVVTGADASYNDPRESVYDWEDGDLNDYGKASSEQSSFVYPGANRESGGGVTVYDSSTNTYKTHYIVQDAFAYEYSITPHVYLHSTAGGEDVTPRYINPENTGNFLVDYRTEEPQTTTDEDGAPEDRKAIKYTDVTVKVVEVRTASLPDCEGRNENEKFNDVTCDWGRDSLVDKENGGTYRVYAQQMVGQKATFSPGQRVDYDYQAKIQVSYTKRTTTCDYNPPEPVDDPPDTTDPPDNDPTPCFVCMLPPSIFPTINVYDLVISAFTTPVSATSTAPANTAENTHNTSQSTASSTTASNPPLDCGDPDYEPETSVTENNQSMIVTDETDARINTLRAVRFTQVRYSQEASGSSIQDLGLQIRTGDSTWRNALVGSAGKFGFGSGYQYYVERDENYDSSTKYTRTDRETVPSNLHALEVHAYPRLQGPAGYPQGANLADADIREFKTTERKVPSLPSYVGLREAESTETYSIASSVTARYNPLKVKDLKRDSQGETIKDILRRARSSNEIEVRGIVDDVSVSTTDANIERTINKSNITVKVLNTTKDKVKVKYKLEDENGNPIDLDDTREEQEGSIGSSYDGTIPHIKVRSVKEDSGAASEIYETNVTGEAVRTYNISNLRGDAVQARFVPREWWHAPPSAETYLGSTDSDFYGSGAHSLWDMLIAGIAISAIMYFLTKISLAAFGVRYSIYEEAQRFFKLPFR